MKGKCNFDQEFSGGSREFAKRSLGLDSRLFFGQVLRGLRSFDVRCEQLQLRPQVADQMSRLLKGFRLGIALCLRKRCLQFCVFAEQGNQFL